MVQQRKAALVRAFLLSMLFALNFLRVGVAVAGPLDPPSSSPSPPPPSPSYPIKVEISIDVNSIYKVETVSETYTIDGYLLMRWKDSRMTKCGEVVYENNLIDDVLGVEIWWPNIEFTNVVGNRETPSRRLVINGDDKCEGTVVYHERFHATLSEKMDFRKYPFDDHYFTIGVESFSHDRRSVTFREMHISNDPIHSDAWSFGDPTAKLSKMGYQAIADMLNDTGSNSCYSRYTLKVHGKRKVGYFIWQLFLPLLLIVGTSWSVFWIPELGDRLATAFTLMLTVVAFNFHIADLLPQLPYNTFAEIIIISGYLEIITVIVIIIATRGKKEPEWKGAEKLITAFRWVIPISYILVLIAIAGYFLCLDASQSDEPGVNQDNLSEFDADECSGQQVS